MIKKNKLIDSLKKCMDREEKAIPIYMQHLNNTLFLSGFKQEEQTEIINILKILSKESEGHRASFEYMLKEIEESSCNVY
jgi:rubrerythrin